LSEDKSEEIDEEISEEFGDISETPETKKKAKRPQYPGSPRVKEIERHSQVDKPQTQWTKPGQTPKARSQIISETGELESISSFDIQKEVNDSQAERARFVSWQARQKKFTMYKFIMYDEEKGMDRWDPMSYTFYPLTVGQWRGIQMQEAKERDLAARINDKDIKDANQQLIKTQIDTLKMKCGLFFRMDVNEYIEDENGDRVPNPDYEFEFMNWQDLRDCVEAATYKNSFHNKRERSGFQSAIS
jgi:hypothetical protein